MEPSQAEVTRLLVRWAAGDLSAREQLVPLVYDRLRRLAAGQLRRERKRHSLESAELVHEALLRLFDQRNVPAQGREQLMGLMAELMRRVLVDHARRRLAQRRNAGRSFLTLEDDLDGNAAELDVLEVHDALKRLAELDRRQARIVELRVFGGFEVTEVATILGLSTATIKREWRTARIWLARELQ